MEATGQVFTWVGQCSLLQSLQGISSVPEQLLESPSNRAAEGRSENILEEQWKSPVIERLEIV